MSSANQGGEEPRFGRRQLPKHFFWRVVAPTAGGFAGISAIAAYITRDRWLPQAHPGSPSMPTPDGRPPFFVGPYAPMPVPPSYKGSGVVGVVLQAKIPAGPVGSRDVALGYYDLNNVFVPNPALETADVGFVLAWIQGGTYSTGLAVITPSDGRSRFLAPVVSTFDDTGHAAVLWPFMVDWSPSRFVEVPINEDVVLQARWFLGNDASYGLDTAAFGSAATGKEIVSTGEGIETTQVSMGVGCPTQCYLAGNNPLPQTRGVPTTFTDVHVAVESTGQRMALSTLPGAGTEQQGSYTLEFLRSSPGSDAVEIWTPGTVLSAPNVPDVG